MTRPSTRPASPAVVVGRVVGGVLGALLLLGGCTGAGADTASGGGESVSDGGGAVLPESAGSDAGGALGADAAADGPAAEGAGGTGDAADAQDARLVVQTGQVRMTADDPARAAGAIASLAEELGGHVDDRHVVLATEEVPASAQLTVRVPADRLTEALDRLTGIGAVGEEQVQAQDVTATSQDLDARIAALRLSVTRLEDLLARATTNEDLLTAETALADRQSSLEVLEQQQRRLAEQVALSTLTIGVTTTAPEAAVAAAPGSFLDGLGTGWTSLVVAVRAGLVVLGVLLPWAVVAAAVVAVAAVVVRRRRARAPAQG